MKVKGLSLIDWQVGAWTTGHIGKGHNESIDYVCIRLFCRCRLLAVCKLATLSCDWALGQAAWNVGTR